MVHYFFVGILLILMGISLIGTILQDKTYWFENSQNMFFGCIGGLIASICGFSIIHSLVIFFICIIISYFIFSHLINNTVFVIKSVIVKKRILCLSVIIVLSGIFVISIFPNFHFIFDHSELLIMFTIFFIPFIIGVVKGIPLFINFVMNFNPDNFKNGENVYITDSYFDSTQNGTMFYGDKKINTRSIHYIIDKVCKIEKINGNNVINIDGNIYSVVEKNNKYLAKDDIVVITRDNLKKGMIRENDSIIVKKFNNKNRFLNYPFISSSLAGLVCFIFVFLGASSYNFYLYSYETVVINTKDVKVENSDNFYYRDITVNYIGNNVTFQTEEQTVRELPNIGDKITVYKIKNGNIKNLTKHDKRGIIVFFLFGVLLELYAISSVIRKPIKPEK